MFPARLIAVATLATVVLSGCVAGSHLSSTQPEGVVQVKKSATSATPRSDTFTATTFGNYEFRATAPGHEPFTGILPLKFNGGYLALDILFFAPAMFFNLREPYAFYEFDVISRQVRYKRKEKDDWTVYVPSQAEITRGQRFFDSRIPQAQ